MTLREYLNEKNQKPAHFARDLGVSKVMVHYWLKGNKKPSPPMILRIESLTGGLVGFHDFYKAE